METQGPCLTKKRLEECKESLGLRRGTQQERPERSCGLQFRAHLTHSSWLCPRLYLHWRLLWRSLLTLGSKDILCHYFLITPLTQISCNWLSAYTWDILQVLPMDQDKGDMLVSSQPESMAVVPLYYMQVRSLIHPWFFFLSLSPHSIHRETLLALTSKSCLDPTTLPTSLSNLCYFIS